MAGGRPGAAGRRHVRARRAGQRQARDRMRRRRTRREEEPSGWPARPGRSPPLDGGQIVKTVVVPGTGQLRGKRELARPAASRPRRPRGASIGAVRADREPGPRLVPRAPGVTASELLDLLLRAAGAGQRSPPPVGGLGAVRPARAAAVAARGSAAVSCVASSWSTICSAGARGRRAKQGHRHLAALGRVGATVARRARRSRTRCIRAAANGRGPAGPTPDVRRGRRRHRDGEPIEAAADGRPAARGAAERRWSAAASAG